MFRIGSELEFLQTFRPLDRRALEIPRGISFPLFVRHYFRWVESSGNRIYLVTGSPNEPVLGVVFRRDQKGGDSPWWRMCEWCHSYGSSSEVGLLTADAHPRRRIGIHACLDMSCAEKIEIEAERTGNDPRRQIERLLQRMDRFMNELFTPADSTLSESPLPEIR